ncbi:site-specific integrase [Paenibacillus thiaminolyticus]|nr:site-specific integrase [Paenibacillus thiaminolyticus]
MAEKPESKIKVFDEFEIAAIIDALNQQPTIWRLMILGTFLGGLRRGELVALEINDCNFGDSSIMIDENIPIKIKGEPLIKAPKTNSSVRRIKMPKWYMDELEAYMKEWEKQRRAAGAKWRCPEGRQFLFHKGWRTIPPKHAYKLVETISSEEWFSPCQATRPTPHLSDIPTGTRCNDKGCSRTPGTPDERTLTTTYSHVTKTMEERAAAEFDRFDRRPPSI